MLDKSPLEPNFWLNYERPELYPKQKAAIYDPHRYSLIEASTKAGKTSGCIAWIIELALRGRSGWNYWWVAPVSDQSLIAFRRTMRSLPQRIFTTNISLKTLTLVNGAVIWFKSGDKPNCYDDQTEILTRRGWRLFRDLDASDAVMTRSAGGIAEWQRPTRIITAPYDGEMVALNNKRVDLCVTPEHRMLIERRRGAAGRGKWNRKAAARLGKTSLPKEMWETAANLRSHDTIPAWTIWTGIDDEAWTMDRCALLGFYLAEGSALGNASTDEHRRRLVKRGGYRINFAQTPGQKGGNKGDVRRAFEGVLNRLDYKWRSHPTGLRMWDKTLWAELVQLGDKYTKFIPIAAKALPAAKLRELLRWMVLGDGSSRRNDDWVYFTASRRLADDVQEIAIKCGWNATISERVQKPYPRPTSRIGGGLLYLVKIQKRGRSHYLGGPGGSYLKRVAYSGMVYCVSVPNRTVLVRRNGKPLWCGNSLYGEDVYGVVVDEASRMKEDAYIAIRSTLTYTEGPIRIIGNVRGRKNWFYQLARRAEQEQDRGLEPREMGYHKIVASDAVAAGVLKAKEIEDARAQMPEQALRELYLAEASDDGGNPFGETHIASCIAPLSSEPPMWWGWDLAKRQDYTVGIALDRNGRCCRFERFHGMPWGDIINRIVSSSGTCPTLVDSTGVGDPILDDLQKRGGANFEGYHFNQSSKQKLMEGLAVAIQARMVTFPGGVIDKELLQYEYEFTRTGVHYTCPAGYYDDCVCALALAQMCRGMKPPAIQITMDMVNRARAMPRRRFY